MIFNWIEKIDIEIDFKIFEPTGECLALCLIISLSPGDASLDGHSDYYMIKGLNAYYWPTNWVDLDADRTWFSITLQELKLQGIKIRDGLVFSWYS